MSQQPDYAALETAYQRSEQRVTTLTGEVDRLTRRLAWFQKQVFGEKSERRLAEVSPEQLALLVGDAPEPPPVEKQVITYERGKATKQRGTDCVTDSGLRFDDTVPVEVITVTPPELSGPDADQYEVIAVNSTHRLAQRPASFVVLRYDHPVIKRRDDNTLITTSAPAGVFDQSMADVSFLAGMLTDKFLYHLPLYRQHQRLGQGGITLSRTTLTNLSKGSIELLRPIAAAQLGHVLQGQVLAMDETPIKAGRTGKGKMKTGWFWPVFGEDAEIVFTYANTRAKAHIELTLGKMFKGTLVSDGYAAYARYAAANADVVHAQCWVHCRRQFIAAEDTEPDLVAVALQYIRELYAIEARIKDQGLLDEQKRHYRLTYSKPLVDAFFAWCDNQLHNPTLLPDNPLIKAIGYACNRPDALRVFLEDPAVPMDTNDLERALRPIPMGRRNWLFAWTELGAEHVGIIQSLICTCKLQGVDPYTYLVDVLQRISVHPASDVIALTPRLWKERFAHAPMRSDLYRAGQ